jgi:serine protease Do
VFIAKGFRAPSNIGEGIMADMSNPDKYCFASGRRALFLASVAGVALATFLGGPGPYRHAGLVAPVHAAAVFPDDLVASSPGFADVVARVKPAVISVQVKIQQTDADSVSDDGSDSGQSKPSEALIGMGSGFFISADGYAVTNNHVVDHANSVQVTTGDGQSHTAKVIGTDANTDLALIKISGANFPYVNFADRAPREGDWVIAIGNPYGLGGTVTAGIVSAHGRDIGSGPYDDFIQIDAPINKGNSGGPAFNLNGDVIGVNTAIFSPSGGSVGIGFDIPAETAKAVIAQLKEQGHVTRGWIGVQAQPLTADIADALGLKTAEGALVDEPQPGSPAAKAGIRSGDVITAVDNAAIENSRQLAQKIGALAPGKPVSLTVMREGVAKTLNVTLGEMPADRQAQAEPVKSEASPDRRSDLGLTLAPAASLPGGGDHGVAVVAVDPDGPGAENGLQAGDVILRVGEEAVSNPDDVRLQLADLHKAGKHSVLMRIKSGEATRYVALPLQRP